MVWSGGRVPYCGAWSTVCEQKLTISDLEHKLRTLTAQNATLQASCSGLQRDALQAVSASSLAPVTAGNDDDEHDATAGTTVSEGVSQLNPELYAACASGAVARAPHMTSVCVLLSAPSLWHGCKRRTRSCAARWTVARLPRCRTCKTTWMTATACENRSSRDSASRPRSRSSSSQPWRRPKVALLGWSRSLRSRARAWGRCCCGLASCPR